MNSNKILRRRKKNLFFSRDLLREAVQSKSERGEQLNALMKEGKLVPIVIVYLKNDFRINLCIFIGSCSRFTQRKYD